MTTRLTTGPLRPRVSWSGIRVMLGGNTLGQTDLEKSAAAAPYQAVLLLVSAPRAAPRRSEGSSEQARRSLPVVAHGAHPSVGARRRPTMRPQRHWRVGNRCGLYA